MIEMLVTENKKMKKDIQELKNENKKLKFLVNQLNDQMHKVMDELNLCKSRIQTPTVTQTNTKQESTSSNCVNNATNTSMVTDRNQVYQSYERLEPSYTSVLNVLEKPENLPKPQNAKKIIANRKSQASLFVQMEKVSLTKRRYDHKMAKNNSVDNVWYSSNYADSSEQLSSKDIGRKIKLTCISMGDQASLRSEKPKAMYYKPTFESHKRIGFSNLKFGMKPKISTHRG
eukprot:CAMPEP_0168317922 /NCGR_PEP_ID=MMETSP0213-20121227/170_1 /TAXON_ID=151035 /ORGANISM="Euplotes harpa, Strain FSP1.4" /LENGTH=229 /DNA_ID=CAMNT_0008318887 /DNA_START=403 /DNA_END=1093 /DNA_ORIENTATION=-